MKSPVDAAHKEYSMVYSQHDNPGKPTEELLDIAITCIEMARRIDLSWIKKRTALLYPDPTEFPGEHYRLLAALVLHLKPKVVIEIGTERGASALSMKSTLSQAATIFTFDVVHWKHVPNTLLIESDFDSQLVQFNDDLTIEAAQRKHQSLFEDADIIFMDAAKDGKMEDIFLTFFYSVKFRKSPLLVIDDIYNWQMLAVWRNISFPKLDISSFAHFTGTGLVLLRP